MSSKEDFNKGLSKAAREALQETVNRGKGNSSFYKKPKQKKPKVANAPTAKAPIYAPKVQPKVVAPKAITKSTGVRRKTGY